jgi:hypothetical protein
VQQPVQSRLAPWFRMRDSVSAYLGLCRISSAKLPELEHVAFEGALLGRSGGRGWSMGQCHTLLPQTQNSPNTGVSLRVSPYECC